MSDMPEFEEQLGPPIILFEAEAILEAAKVEHLQERQHHELEVKAAVKRIISEDAVAYVGLVHAVQRVEDRIYVQDQVSNLLQKAQVVTEKLMRVGFRLTDIMARSAVGMWMDAGRPLLAKSKKSMNNHR